MKRQRKIAIAGMTGALLIGAGTGTVLNLPNGAGASAPAATSVTDPSGDTSADTTADTTVTSDTTDTTDDTSATSDDTTATTDDTPDQPAGGRGAVLQSSLDELVAAGTITQAQADAIIAGVEANRPTPPVDGAGRVGPGMGERGGHGGFGGHGPGQGRGANLDTAATALGMTADELRTELEAGKTIAEVATEKGVDVQTVIDAIVAEETADITARVTDRVNGVKPTKPAEPTDSTDSTTDDGATTTTTG